MGCAEDLEKACTKQSKCSSEFQECYACPPGTTNTVWTGAGGCTPKIDGDKLELGFCCPGKNTYACDGGSWSFSTGENDNFCSQKGGKGHSAEGGNCGVICGTSSASSSKGSSGSSKGSSGSSKGSSGSSSGSSTKGSSSSLGASAKPSKMVMYSVIGGVVLIIGAIAMNKKTGAKE